MALISITGSEVDVLRGPRGLAGADGGSGSGGGDPPDIASEAEARAGADNTKMMTALRVLQSIDSNEREPASQAEAEAGSNNTKDMSPLRTAQAITALSMWSKIDSHSAHFGDATDGMDFDSQEIGDVGHPLIRNVWTPRTGGVPAIDITPKGLVGVDYVAIGGRLGWHEFCSSDFLGAENGLPFHSMRLAVHDDGGSIGTHDFNGQTAARPWSLYVNGNVLGRFNEYGNLYTLGGARSGAYTIADDAVQAIQVPTLASPRWAILAIQRNAPGMAGFLRIKAGTSPVAPVEISMIAGSVALEYKAVIVTGPSGHTDGSITISAASDGFVYILNRSGASILIGTYWMILS